MVNYVVAKRVDQFSVVVLRVVRHRASHFVRTAEPRIDGRGLFPRVQDDRSAR